MQLSESNCSNRQNNSGDLPFRAGRLIILYLVILFCIFMYGIGRIYGFVFYPDEFGYWASAAQMAGYDWSNVASLGSYYSFGYSLILLPVLKLIPDSVTAYRTAIGINVVMLSIVMIMLYDIAGRLAPDFSKQIRIMFAAIAAFYPTWLFYMQTTLCEITVLFTFVLSAWILIRYLEKPDTGKLILFMFSLIYLYMTHMRNIGVLAAAVITMLIMMVRERTDRKRLVIFFLILAVGALAATGGKMIIQHTVYGNADKGNIALNDYAGQIAKVLSLLTVSGLTDFVVSFTGKIYYLGAASYGLFYFGSCYLMKRVLRTLKRERSRLFYFHLFVLLSAVLEILVEAVYKKGYDKIDSIMYGRYAEHMLPVLMIYGLIGIWKLAERDRRLLCRILLSIIMLNGFLTGVIVYVIRFHDLYNIHGGYFIAGLSYLMRFIPFNRDSYFQMIFYPVVFLTVLICVLILISVRRHELTLLMMTIFIVMEVATGISLNEQYTYSFNSSSYGNEQMAITLQEMQKGRTVVSVGNDGEDAFISSIQFILRGCRITLVSEEQMETLKADDLVILSYEHKECRPALSLIYSHCMAMGSFWLYYND